MTRDETLRELQRRIALAKGYTGVYVAFWADGRLAGTLHADEGPTLIPRWPWDWCAAGELVEEMQAACVHNTAVGFVKWTSHGHTGAHRFELHPANRAGTAFVGIGHTYQAAAARCWCAWKDIDLSGLP
jgi:hypothetical protein